MPGGTTSSGCDGRLTAAPASPFPAQGLGPFSCEFRPTDPSQLFVFNAHNVDTGTGTISAFTDSQNSTLTSVAGSPFADQQTAPCWVKITHDGTLTLLGSTRSARPAGSARSTPASVPAAASYMSMRAGSAPSA